MHGKIDQGLFGGIVVLGRCDRPPRRFRFPWRILRPIYLDIARREARQIAPAKKKATRKAAADHDRNDDADLEALLETRGREEYVDDALELPPALAFRRLKNDTRLLLAHHRDFLEEFMLRELVFPRRIINTDHVPVFFHVMTDLDARALFDTEDIHELGGDASLTFDTAGDFEYFCQHHPNMTGKVHVVPGGPTPVTVTITPGPPPAFSSLCFLRAASRRGADRILISCGYRTSYVTSVGQASGARSISVKGLGSEL